MDLMKFQKPKIGDISSFMSYLENTRNKLSENEWKNSILSETTINEWRYFLCNDPYTRWAYIKPRGYAGDATVMDFAYKHSSVRKEVSDASEVGQRIYEITSSSTQSISARKRIKFIANHINRISSESSGLSIASFASGHGRELESLTDEAVNNISKFTAIDNDINSLMICQDSANRINFKAVNKNVFYLRNQHEKYDLIYSLGLFDYLKLKQARYLLDKMVKMLKPDGKLIIANLNDCAGNIGYCEAIMDWWMITRSKNDMLNMLVSTSINDSSANVTCEKIDCFNYMMVESNGTCFN